MDSIGPLLIIVSAFLLGGIFVSHILSGGEQFTTFALFATSSLVTAVLHFGLSLVDAEALFVGMGGLVCGALITNFLPRFPWRKSDTIPILWVLVACFPYFTIAYVQLNEPSLENYTLLLKTIGISGVVGLVVRR